MTAPDPSTWLAAGRAMEAAATAGPWDAYEHGIDSDHTTWAIEGRDGEWASQVGDLLDQHDAAWIADARSRLPAALGALGAVLELHQPQLYESGGPVCSTCRGTAPGYPCPTVTAITAAIGEGQP